MSPRRTWAIVAFVTMAAVAAAVLAFVCRPRHPPTPHTLPFGRPGPEADTLLAVLNRSVQGSAWTSTGAVRWTVAHGRTHLWDRLRHLDAQTVGDDRVLLNLAGRSGKAWHGTTELSDRAATRALAAAWTAWVHDAF